VLGTNRRRLAWEVYGAGRGVIWEWMEGESGSGLVMMGREACEIDRCGRLTSSIVAR
jgi:hypothetical protein